MSINTDRNREAQTPYQGIGAGPAGGSGDKNIYINKRTGLDGETGEMFLPGRFAEAALRAKKAQLGNLAIDGNLLRVPPPVGYNGQREDDVACEICGRSSCTRSFHSWQDQEDFDNKTGKYAENDHDDGEYEATVDYNE